MSDREVRHVAGFTVRAHPEVDCTVYVGPTGSDVDIDVELTDRITCTLRLLPAPAVSAIVVRHGQNGPRPADVELADRLAQEPDLPAVLSPYVAALDAAGTPGAGRIWAVELALRAAEVIDRLELGAGEPGEGVWPVWSATCGAAAQALSEVPSPVRTAGDSALRVAVLTIAKRLRPRADRLATDWLDDLVARWPVPEADTPIDGDATMAELRATPPMRPPTVKPSVRRRVYLGGQERGHARVPVTLTMDLDVLVRIGLVDRAEGVLATPVGIDAHRAWEVRIRVRDEVATAFLALSTSWSVWQAATIGRRVPLTDDVRLDLSCRYGELLASTHLPYTLEEFLQAAALTHPTPPHLADVMCLVRAGDVVGPVGLMETEVSIGRGLDLVATIPHGDAPTVDTLSVVVPSPRTPMVSAKVRTIAQRMLALRRELAEGALAGARRTRAVRDLQKMLDEPELKDALNAEVNAAGQGLTAEVRTLVHAIRRSEPDIAEKLRAAAVRRDLDQVSRLAAHLSRTRAYLTGIAG